MKGWFQGVKVIYFKCSKTKEEVILYCSISSVVIAWFQSLFLPTA